MRAVKSRDTKPELAVRAIVRGLGFGYRLHSGDLPGRPDLVFRGRKKVIFVHGCFWHSHAGCKASRLPRTRREWWREKLSRNVERDIRNLKLLHETGWDSLVIWECELKSPKTAIERIKDFLVNEETPHDVDKYPVKNDFSSSNQLEDAPERVRKETIMSEAPQLETDGLDVERRLPEGFKAKTDVVAKTVKITKGRRSIHVPLKSFASVANVLAMFTEQGRLEELTDAAILTLKDEFTGSSTSITAAEMPAVSAAIAKFVATKPRRSSGAKITKPPTEVKASPSADLKVVKTAKKKPKLVSDTSDIPWSSALAREHSDDDFDMKLIKIAVSEKSAKKVLGLPGDKDLPSDCITLPGYEVTVEGNHVCWVVVENEATFHIIKTAFYKNGSTHRNFEGVVARLKFGVVPRA